VPFGRQGAKPGAASARPDGDGNDDRAATGSRVKEG
jgi:hypothetical protein